MDEKLSKASLRRELKSRLQTISPEQQTLLLGRVQSWLSDQTGTWGAFWPLPFEPDLRFLWSQPGPVTWVFPRIQGHELTFHQAGREDWMPGPYGTQEPGPHAPKVSLASIQGLLIPGLGFDRKGGRLGRGKGYYDRVLAGWSGKKVGVCFETQMVPEVPNEAHDQNMDVILTDVGTWSP